ncbi:MAG: ATP-grasp domain-containing protein, partial [Planctomycetia bacterium]|nr:ATP-grasp domain-containing protein [Planctomycetia bacterium]
PPTEVQRVQWLDAYYPLLMERGLPCIRTALLPLADQLIDALQSPDDVQARLGETLQPALTAAQLDLRRGLYIRTFLASLRNTHPAYYFAHTPKELHGTCFRVLQMMRGKNDVGGLALREYVSLEAIDLPADGPGVSAVQVHHEMRLTIFQGKLLMASFHGPFLQLSLGQQDRLRQAFAARAPRTAVLADLSRRLQQAGLPDNYVADVAFLSNGQPVLVELNPFYSAGSNVPAARAWLLVNLGAKLAEQAGYAPTLNERLRELAAHLAGAPLYSDGVFLFGADCI